MNGRGFSTWYTSTALLILPLMVKFMYNCTCSLQLDVHFKTDMINQDTWATINSFESLKNTQ